MKVLAFTISFILLSLLSSAQVVTTYVNRDGEWCPKSKALYMRTTAMVGTVYQVRDYFLTGELFMDALCSSVEPLVFEGRCTYYYKNHQRQMEGDFVHGRMSDNWTYWSEQGEDLALNKVPEDTSYHIHDSMVMDGLTEAEFPGGTDVLVEYIKMNTRYPIEMQKRSISGRARVLFVVDTTGKVTQIRFLNRIAPALEEEARRVLSSMPLWQPAVYKGKKVRVRRVIPINFDFK